jgi:hypothetical protein
VILSYGWRLVCLSLFVFLIVHTILGAGIALIAPVAVRAADRIRPRVAARLLLGLRLLPAAAAIFVVVACCVPSYLRLEQEAGGEQIGRFSVIAAAGAAAWWAFSLGNLTRALVRSARYTRHCERSGAPVLMLTGILRPRLVVSQAIRRALTEDQLDAALRHEQAHRRAFDNFKRLLLAATPRMPGFTALERSWSRISEWAADDEAVAGSALRALCLADALVRVARLGTVPAEVSFLGDGRDLARRVDRLLHPQTYRRPRRNGYVLACGAGLAILVAAFVAVQPLEMAHEVMEHLVH